MGHSIRVETYLDYETVRELDRATDNRSEFIRELVEDELGVAANAD